MRLGTRVAFLPCLILPVCAVPAQIKPTPPQSASSSNKEQEWKLALKRLENPARRDQEIARMDAKGAPAVRLLIESLDFQSEGSTRARIYALRELAHQGAEHYAELSGRRGECPGGLLPDFLDLESDFIRFLPEAESKSGRTAIQNAALAGMTGTEDLELRPRFGSVFYRCLHATPHADHEVSELIAFLRKAHDSRHSEDAARLLGRLGSAAEEAVPDLTKLLRKPIRKSRPTTHTGNIQVTYDAAAKDHRRCALALTRVAAGTEPAAEAWGYLAKHGTAWDLSRAMTALRRAPDTAGPAVEGLLGGLDGSARRTISPLEKAEIVTTLGILGPRAKEAGEFLKKLVDGDDKRLAALARAALRSIGDR